MTTKRRSTPQQQAILDALGDEQLPRGELDRRVGRRVDLVLVTLVSKGLVERSHNPRSVPGKAYFYRRAERSKP